MTKKVHRYSSDSIDVTYDLNRCIHAEECVHGLPAVFDKAKRPWIQPANSNADELAAVIERCPTGSLHYERKDNGSKETPDPVNTITLAVNGPLYVRGDIEIVSPDGGAIILKDTRVALCRCGNSQNKPFCDNAHIDAGFMATDTLYAESTAEKNPSESPRLKITPQNNGSLMIEGNYILRNQARETLDEGSKVWLCRCGGSQKKPFCDGSHKKNGFKSVVN